MKKHHLTVLFIACYMGSTACAGDREDYNKAVATRYMEMFRSADRDGDRVVTRLEARGNVELEATFDDIDINRDGFITWSELQRYLDFRFRS